MRKSWARCRSAGRVNPGCSDRDNVCVCVWMSKHREQKEKCVGVHE